MRNLKNQSGQLVVEAVLLMVLGLFVATSVSAYFQKSQFLQKIIAQPWTRLSGMIECGTWNPCGPGMHPNTRDRNLSLDPKDTP